MMKMNKMFCLALCFFGIAASAQPEPQKNAVLFENIPPEIQSNIKKMYPSLESGSVDLQVLDEAMKSLHQAAEFEIIQLLQSGDKYIFRIVPSDQIKNLVFVGLQGVSTSEAEGAFQWRSGQLITEERIQDGVEKLQNLLRGRGYLKAAATYKIVRDEKQKLQGVVSVVPNQQTVIDTITVQSPNEELNKRLVGLVKRRKKPVLSDEEIQSIQDKLREYLMEGRYLRAQIHGPTISYSKDELHADLNYQIEEPVEYAFEFKGPQYMSQRQLVKTLQLENYISTNPNVGSELATRLRTAYVALGFARIEIEDKTTVERNDFKKITFDIKEGPRVGVEKWVFAGKITQDQKYYTKLVLKNASEIIQDGYFVKEDLDTAISNLKVALQNEGYLTAKIVSTRYQYNRDRDKVTVYVNLDEGPLTHIGEITFEGNTAFSVNQLRTEIDMQEGRPLYLSLIEESLNKIRTFYQERGFIEMSITNEKTDLITYNEDNSVASLKFVIHEGPKVQVASILYEGNTFTQDEVIRNELEFQAGDILTPAKIDDSVLRLQRTGYFNSIDIRMLEENTSVSQRTVIVRVTERDPGLFIMGLGATNEHTLTVRGYTGVGYNNILGTGRGISLRLQGNYNVTDLRYLETQITLGYLEPHLFNTKNRGRVNLSRSSLVTDYTIQNVTQTNQTTYTIERDFTRYISASWDVWSLATTSDFTLDGARARREQNIATTAVTVDLDHRNNIFNPTQGSFTRLNVEYSHPSFGGNDTINYWKSVESFSYYRPFWRTWNWAQLFKVGYLENLSKEPDGGVPYDKKGFILGGQSTIRGFQAGTLEAFPNARQLKADKDSPYFLKTQSTMALIKSEVRFPLIGNFGGALFYDGGYVDVSGLQFEDYYRDAAGFGLRYNTPVGPFNMEVGKKLDRREGEDPWVFHLSIGTF